MCKKIKRDDGGDDVAIFMCENAYFLGGDIMFVALDLSHFAILKKSSLARAKM